VRDALLHYLETPSSETVLVLVQGAGEEVETDLARRATTVLFDRLPPDRVRRWVEHRASQLGATLDEGVAELLVEAVAGELGAAAQELEKLAAQAAGGVIRTADLAAVAGVRRGETVADFVAAALARDPVRAAALIVPILEQPGASGVRLVSALGTALVGTALARAERDRGTPPARLRDIMLRHLEASRPAGLGSWRDTAARWAAWAGDWDAAGLRAALRLALEADSALKNPTIRDEAAIVTDLVLRFGVAVAA
jgi:DNA polymerase III delta subunit